MRASRALLLRVFRGLLRIYFRNVHVLGHTPDRQTVRRLFAANHVNALVDPLLVLTACPCPLSPVAKSTLFKVPVLRGLLRLADAIPVVRRKDVPEGDPAANRAAFSRVVRHLELGKNILIFPEGVSHNEPRILPLKTGAARMLSEAAAAGVSHLTYQSVGLEFDAKDTFRSQAVIVFGEPRAMPTGLDERETIETITRRIGEDLAELVVEGASTEERTRILRVAELYTHGNPSGDFAALLDVGKAVGQARKALAVDRDFVAKLEGQVDDYFRALDRARLRDVDVVSPLSLRTIRGFRVRLLALAPLALAGGLLYWLPYQLPRWVARRAGQEADLRSTYKLAVGLLAFPLWALVILAALFGRMALGTWALVALLVVASPFAALVWLDVLERTPTLAATRGPLLAGLRARRETLMARLEEARVRATR